VRDQVRRAVKSHDEKADSVGHRTIFSEILESDLPAVEKENQRLGDEARLIVAAGTDTVKNAVTVASFHILNTPEIHKRLAEELVVAMPDRDSTLTLTELEGLPYLTAIIQEGIFPTCILWSCN
jgi:cytochrome P450